MTVYREFKVGDYIDVARDTERYWVVEKWIDETGVPCYKLRGCYDGGYFIAAQHVLDAQQGHVVKQWRLTEGEDV